MSGEGIGVIADAALEFEAVEDGGEDAAGEPIVVVAAVDRVVAFAALHHVLAGAAIDGVVARAAVEAIDCRAAADDEIGEQGPLLAGTIGRPQVTSPILKSSSAQTSSLPPRVSKTMVSTFGAVK